MPNSQKLTNASSSDAGVVSMNLGRHPLAIDDELVAGTTNVDLGDLLAVDGLRGCGEFDARL